MRELLFKNLTSGNAHRRDLFISEMVTQGNVVIRTQRRSVYFVKNCTKVKDVSNLDELKKLNDNGELKKRHFYVIKKHNNQTGEDGLFCKVRGFLYVVVGNSVYLIEFINAFKINVKKGELSKL